MSWLSELFGGGDDAIQAEMMRQAAEDRRIQEAQARADAEKEALRQKNVALRQSTADTSRNAALQYFQNMGLNPNDFSGDIDARIAQALGTTADDDPNIGQYLTDLGQSVYDTREGGARSKAGRDIDMLFQPEFESQRISDTLDDPILAQIDAAERGEANNFVDNLLKRGVITEAGRSGAYRNLDEQGARVRGILDQIGKGTLAGGRQDLTNIANRGRQTAQTLRLGQSFDPGFYGSEANRTTDEFLGGLSDKIRGQITDNLYDTSGLAAVAGAAQGGQNLKFDPRALAGQFLDDENPDDNETNPAKRVTF